MENPKFLSTSEAANLIGVSVATVKRWVDDGTLPATKTMGGHRRLLKSDVLRLIDFQKNRNRVANTSPPATKSFQVDENFDKWHHLLFRSLLDGDIKSVRSYIQGLYHNDIGIDRIADYVIAPAMHEIGVHWETGRIDVYEEHRATRLLESVLFELKVELEQQSFLEKPVAIGGAPENDPTVLPSLLIQMVLLDNGWEAVNLGPQTPLSSFRKAIVDLRPRLLWLSMTHLIDDNRDFLAEYEELYRLAEKKHVAVAIGGRALTPALRSTLPYTSFGDGLLQFAAFARQLHSHPRLANSPISGNQRNANGGKAGNGNDSARSRGNGNGNGVN